MSGKMIPARDRLLTAGLRSLYDLLYHQFAWSYDIVAAAVSLGRWQSWVKACLPYLNGPRILEIGYGPGHLQAEMDSRGLQVFGVDASPEMAHIAHERLLRKGIKSKVINGYAQSMPFSSSVFDQVVATFPSEYIADPQALSEINRILKPGGMLLIIPFAWLTGKHWYERALSGLLKVPQRSSDWETRFLQPFFDAGFTCSLTEINFISSALLIIQAVKEPAS
jgi:ubiquinone/menaquinone biosynthesis C-methylase UbiE